MIQLLRIDKIKIENNIATCNFYPENKKEFGTLKLDLNTEELINCEQPSIKCADMYIGQATSKLASICKSEDPLPEEAFCIWF